MSLVSIFSLLLIIVLSILVTRVAANILAHTGLSRNTARFQARSAFTGVGFTTEEAEKVVNHPIRRRVIQTLMLLGSAGLVTAVTTLILAFVRQGEASFPFKLALLVGGVVVLWAAASSRWADRQLSRLIDAWLRRFTTLHVRDYESLQEISRDYHVVTLEVRPGDWLAGQTLGKARLREEGIEVLGIIRPNGVFVGVPDKHTPVRSQDRLVLYGREPDILELDRRRRSRRAESRHRTAVRRQAGIHRRDRKRDPDRTNRPRGPKRRLPTRDAASREKNQP